MFETLQEEGGRLGIPQDKKRALLREYLQTRIIYSLYSAEESRELSFIGGTSLRLLQGLDRFSEDLDFDNLGLPFSSVKNVFGNIASQLKREGLELQYAMKKTDSSGIGQFRFPELLFSLGISSHRDEKLTVKIDYTTPREKPQTQFAILSRFGFVQNVLTNTMEALLAEKIRAIFTRKDLQPRDFYDVVWLLARNIQPDTAILSSLNIKSGKEAFEKLDELFTKRVQPNLLRFKQRLQPFLIAPEHIAYLDRFPGLMKQAAAKSTSSIR